MTRAWVRGPAGSTSCPGRPGLVPEVPCCRPSAPGDLGPCPWARGIDQLSRVTQAWVQAPAVSTPVPGDAGSAPRLAGSTTCPGRLATGCEVPRCQATLLGDSGQGARTLVFTQLSLATWAQVRGTTVPPAVPGELGPGLSARCVYLLPRVTRARVRGHAVSTSTPRHLVPGPMPTGSTSCPG